MTKLTYKIVSSNDEVLAEAIETYAAAVQLNKDLKGKIEEVYTPFNPEKPKFDRSKCKKSEEWLAKHSS